MTARSLACGLALGALSLGLAPTEAPPPPPRYSLALDVAYGTPPGPERPLRRIVEGLLARLGGSPCFGSVESLPLATPRDLQLIVRLDDFEDVTHNEASISERVSPNSNPIDMASRVVATVSARTGIELRLGSASGEIVRAKHWLAAESWRPQQGEDPHAAAEEEFVEKVVQEVESLACKGGATKLARAIEKARGAR